MSIRLRKLLKQPAKIRLPKSFFLLLLLFAAAKTALAAAFHLDELLLSQEISVLWQFKPEGYHHMIDRDDVSLSLTAKIPFEFSPLLEKPWITVFIDKSGSMKRNFQEIRDFLPGLLMRIPECNIRFITFDRLSKKTEFRDSNGVEFDLSQITPKGPTRLWDLMYFEAKDQQHILAPKFFIVLSDGHDQALLNSPRPYSKFRVSDVAHEMVNIRSRGVCLSFGRDPNEEDLEKIAKQTGGTYFHKGKPEIVAQFIKDHIEHFFTIRFTDPFTSLTTDHMRKICLAGKYQVKNTTEFRREYSTRKGFLTTIPRNKPMDFTLHLTKYVVDRFPETTFYFQAYHSKEVVTDLVKDDLELYLKADIDRFKWENPEIPIRLGILADTTGSMKREERSVKETVKELLAKLPDNVFPELYMISRDYPYYRLITNEYLQKMEFKGPTPIYDSMYNIIIRLAENNERKRLLVITDGWDEYFEGTRRRTSKKKAVEVINLGFLSNVKVYTNPIGEFPNIRTLYHISKGTNAWMVSSRESINTTVLAKPELFRYRLAFNNPFWATEIPVKADILIRRYNFMFFYRGEDWQLTPLPLLDQVQ